MPDAIQLLEKQHKEVNALFKKIEKAEGEEKVELFEELADALAVHATIEEKHFYPATRSLRTEELLHEAVEEHLGVKRLIADLMDLDGEDEQFDAKITVLQEQVEHHVGEEEDELFPKVRKLLSKEQLENLALVMQEHAEELQAAGSPRAAVPGETDHAAPLE